VDDVLDRIGERSFSLPDRLSHHIARLRPSQATEERAGIVTTRPAMNVAPCPSRIRLGCVCHLDVTACTPKLLEDIVNGSLDLKPVVAGVSDEDTPRWFRELDCPPPLYRPPRRAGDTTLALACLEKHRHGARVHPNEVVLQARAPEHRNVGPPESYDAETNNIGLYFDTFF
jgi:hypothetical protein